MLRATRIFVVGVKKKTVNIHAHMSGRAGLTASVSRARFDYSNLPMEEQMKQMWADQRKLEDRIDQVDKVHRDSAAKLEKMINDTAIALTAKIQESREHLNRFLADDYKWEFLGLMVTFVGIVYGSLPKVVAGWFGP
jgi:hypothetical protein